MISYKQMFDRFVPKIKEKTFNTYDIDGVIFINKKFGGINPGPNDIIITGRSWDEEEETRSMLKERGLNNILFMNPIPFDMKTRQSSGNHKAMVLNELISYGFDIGFHFEDDPIQALEINNNCKRVPVILIGSNEFTNLENVRHLDF